MTKYEEVAETAKAARQAWFHSQTSCMTYAGRLMRSLIDYAKIPDGRISYLRFDKATDSFKSLDKSVEDCLPNAIVFDDDLACWVVGVTITLTPAGTYPPQWFSFALGVKAGKDENRPAVGIGHRKQFQELNLEDQQQLGSFWDRLLDEAKDEFTNPNNRKDKAIGFSRLSS